MEMEVVWNGGALLPPRSERCGPMWRNMLDDKDAGLLGLVLTAADKLQAGIKSGRFCKCGCGLEMIYRSDVWAGYMNTEYRVGHNRRMLSRGPRPCRMCAETFTPAGTFKELHYSTSSFCSRRCNDRFYRSR